jgi:multidrug efflux pump subunit AcrA (membrane-fusion protein)
MRPPFLRTSPLFFAALLPAGCAGPAAPAAEESPPAPVKWEGPVYLPLEEWTELFGTTQAPPGAAGRVEARIDGRVRALLTDADGKPLLNARKEPIREGQFVEAGDVIGLLDDRLAVLNRDKAQAALAAAQADKEQADSDAQLATTKRAQLEAVRKKNPELVAEIDVTTARAAEKAANARVAAAEKHVDVAAKDLDTATVQLKLYALVAPRKGRLGRVQATVGQSLAVGAPVADLIDLDEGMDVLCFGPAAVAAKLHVMQPPQEARLGGLDGARDSDPAGSVVYVGEQAEPDSGCFAVKVHFDKARLDKAQLHLRANAAVRVRVLTATDADFSIPESALMEDQEPPAVVIVQDVQTVKNADGQDEQVGTALRLQAVAGIHDRHIRDQDGKPAPRVAIKGLKDPEGKWSGDLGEALFVTERGRGLQTGDKVKLQQEEGD